MSFKYLMINSIKLNSLKRQKLIMRSFLNKNYNKKGVLITNWYQNPIGQGDTFISNQINPKGTNGM